MRIAHRLFSALFALWFTVLTVEPARLHTCPMHDGTPAAAHDMAAMHGGHDHQAEHGPATHHTCSCLGTCSSSVAVPSTPVVPVFDARVVVVVDGGLREVTRPSESVAHATPFANGPPRA